MMPPPPPIPNRQNTPGVAIFNTLDTNSDKFRRRMVRDDPSSESDDLCQSIREYFQNQMSNSDRRIEAIQQRMHEIELLNDPNANESPEPDR